MMYAVLLCMCHRVLIPFGEAEGNITQAPLFTFKSDLTFIIVQYSCECQTKYMLFQELVGKFEI